jgi:flavin-binding protein dodecin
MKARHAVNYLISIKNRRDFCRAESSAQSDVFRPTPGSRQAMRLQTGGRRIMALRRVRWGHEARQIEESSMAKKNVGGVYKIVEVVGISKTSWEDAGRKAVEVASKSLRDLRVAEVIKTDMKVEGGKVTAYRTRVSLSFKYEA